MAGAVESGSSSTFSSGLSEAGEACLSQVSKSRISIIEDIILSLCIKTKSINVNPKVSRVKTVSHHSGLTTSIPITSICCFFPMSFVYAGFTLCIHVVWLLVVACDQVHGLANKNSAAYSSPLGAASAASAGSAAGSSTNSQPVGFPIISTDFSKDYSLKKEIGSGYTSKCYLCLDVICPIIFVVLPNCVCE